MFQRDPALVGLLPGPLHSERNFLPGRFRDRVRRLPKTTRQEIARTIEALREAVGQPHLHMGLGIRQLSRNYFECRVGIALRLVFRLEAGLVTLTFVGTQDEVRRFARNQL